MVFFFIAQTISEHLFKVFDMGEEEQDIIIQKVQEAKVKALCT